MHLDAPGQRHGQQSVSGTADPGVVKQDKSSRGTVDTTKTRSGPQRVRMSSGERPMGAAKGKQSDTEALCHPPPPLLRVLRDSRLGAVAPTAGDFFLCMLPFHQALHVLSARLAREIPAETRKRYYHSHTYFHTPKPPDTQRYACGISGSCAGPPPWEPPPPRGLPPPPPPHRPADPLPPKLPPKF